MPREEEKEEDSSLNLLVPESVASVGVGVGALVSVLSPQDTRAYGLFLRLWCPKGHSEVVLSHYTFHI
ncbi:hypothetical protein KQX54_020924 [Cotesia glomerata]|uniref:Uncharacterized protein n=1 Tax=Cotesia glomerata TaxID=32391 RepID=A0AAV7J8V7_COTGL|nr:hypothetical protein KQX54_020924 [Cotesia glomerata]